MNREIKFRAWDEVSEKMLNWNDFLDTNMKNTFIAPESTGLILMQYTGLHDKNGKEIYEGDIVKYRDSRGQHIEKVIFDKGCFYAGMHWGSSTRVAPKLINTRITEVIGNVYDNPELLGGE
jgi:hypothetical protein